MRAGEEEGEDRGELEPMANDRVNLALAKSYHPVCVYVTLVAAVCTILVCLRALSVPGMQAFVVVAVVLYIDRSRRKEFLLNTNTLATFVLFSLAFNEGRRLTNAQDIRKTAAAIALNVVWAVLGVTSVLNLESTLSVFRYVPFNSLVMCSILLCIHSFVYHPIESDFIILLRVSDFTVLSFVWIYIFHSPYMNTRHVFDCNACLVQFGSVLFTAPVIAFITTVIHCAVFVYHYRTMAEQQKTHLQYQLSEREHDSDIEKNSHMESNVRIHGESYHHSREHDRDDLSPASPPFIPSHPSCFSVDEHYNHQQPSKMPDMSEVQQLFEEAKMRYRESGMNTRGFQNKP
jgi:hypothetical protein